MASRDLVKVCAGLCQVGVEIKPEEAQSPNRTVASRVVLDFAIQAFMVCPELMKQPLAINLDNHCPNSVASPFCINRLILLKEALRLLSRGGQQFSFSDLYRPEGKRFNNLLQQMLKYIVHSERVYDLVNEESSNLDEAACRIERQREELEYERSKLAVVQQRLEALNAADIPNALTKALEQKDALALETEQINKDYIELKSFLEKSREEIPILTDELTTQEARLNELRELVVTDPETCVKELAELGKEVLQKREDLSVHERTSASVLAEMKALSEVRNRAEKISEMAKKIMSAVDELDLNSKSIEVRLSSTQAIIADLDSEKSALQSIIESRNRQLETVNSQESTLRQELEAMEIEGAAKGETLSKTEKQKESLKTTIDRLKEEIAFLHSRIAEIEEKGCEKARREHIALQQKWSQHLEMLRQFEIECELAQKEIDGKCSSLKKIAQAIETINKE